MIEIVHTHVAQIQMQKIILVSDCVHTIDYQTQPLQSLFFKVPLAIPIIVCAALALGIGRS